MAVVVDIDVDPIDRVDLVVVRMVHRDLVVVDYYSIVVSHPVVVDMDHDIDQSYFASRLKYFL